MGVVCTGSDISNEFHKKSILKELGIEPPYVCRRRRKGGGILRRVSADPFVLEFQTVRLPLWLGCEKLDSDILSAACPYVVGGRLN